MLPLFRLFHGLRRTFPPSATITSCCTASKVTKTSILDQVAHAFKNSILLGVSWVEEKNVGTRPRCIAVLNPEPDYELFDDEEFSNYSDQSARSSSVKVLPPKSFGNRTSYGGCAHMSDQCLTLGSYPGLECEHCRHSAGISKVMQYKRSP